MRPVTPGDIKQQLYDAMIRGDTYEMERLDTLLTELTPPAPPATAVQAALWYASVGLRVLALQPGTKVPLKGSRGCSEATSDPDTIRAWWSRTPDANVGIATGHLVDVIDVDGPAGAATWYREMWDADNIYIGPPILGRVSTPRAGGAHIYITADPARRNGTNIVTGVDQRATGGYVCAPPSSTPNGTYRWTTPLVVT